MTTTTARAVSSWAPALGGYALIALILTGPGLAGRGSVGTDTLLDWDPLYSTGSFPPLPAIYDYSSIVLDYPRDLAFARGLHAGRVDLWNPLVAQGTPLWAEQGGPFFPLELPFYLWPTRETYHLFLALRLVLGALGVFALARAGGLSPTASFTAGACFELSGVSIAHLPFGSASATYVLPWLILGAGVLGRAPAFATAAAVACAVGLAGHAGHPTIILLVLAAFAVAVGGHAAAAWRTPRRALAITLWASIAFVLGLGIAAPRLLPLAEMTAVGHTYKRETTGELIRAEIEKSRQGMPIALFAPGALEEGARSLGSLGPFGAAVGGVGLVTAIAGLLRGGLGAGPTAVLVLGGVLALSPPGFGWVGRLPGIALIRPIYAPALIALVLAYCAGCGVQAVGEARGRRALVAAWGIAILGLTALCVEPLREWWPKSAEIVQDALGSRAGTVRLLLPAAVALLGVAACTALWRRGLGRFAAAALAALAVAERLAIVLPLTHLPASTVLSSPPSPAVEFLQDRLAGGEARLLGTSMRIGFPHSPSIFGLADARGIAALAVGRYADYLQIIGPKSVSTTLYAPQPFASPLVDLAGIRYFVSAGPPAGDAGAAVVYQDSHVTILENRAARSRVRIVHQSTAAAGRADAIRWLESAAAREVRARDGELASKVVLEPSADGEAPPVLVGGSPTGEEVRLVEHDDPDRLVLDARLVEPGLVVIADTFYPGWKATVDGRPAAIHPADVLFRAIYVEPGSHRIELAYEPAPFRYGLILCAVSSLVCLAGLLRRRRVASRASVPSLQRYSPIL